MSLTPEPPLTRRALREARRAGQSGAIPAQEQRAESPTTGAVEPGAVESAAADTGALESTGGVGAGAAAPATTGSTTAIAEPPVTTLTTQILGPDGQPLTRRRLRELREKGLIASGATPVVSETGPAATEAPVAADESEEPAATPVEEPVEAERSESEPAPAAESEVEAGPESETEIEAESDVEAASAAEPELRGEVEVDSEPEVESEPEVDSEPVADSEPEGAEEAAAESQQSEPEPPAQPSSPFAPSATESQSWTAPQGHWTRQLEDDDSDSFETTFSREVGVSQATTSAIIIQDVPAAMDLSGPLDSTGEILLTGSIVLPPNLAATGAVTPISDDADDVARLDDQAAAEYPADAPPVKAAAVASQHALGTPIVANAHPRGNRTLTVLLASASVLAVLVTALVVTAIALNWI